MNKKQGALVLFGLWVLSILFATIVATPKQYPLSYIIFGGTIAFIWSISLIASMFGFLRLYERLGDR